ncbi:alpha/beta hydrolase [Nitratireductor luteus]|uniref:alpha/beta hydrolase n=1 Tax=Nitratireductor luteus TaxID=2976980 RepID=UPI00223F3559|nr:alpha/beta hydrolase [Nitratireductor luteus]
MDALANVPSPEMQAVIERLAREDGRLGDPTLLPPAEGRAMAAAANVRWNRDLPALERCTDLSVPVEDGRAIDCRLFTPARAASGLIFFIHGGGWAFCSIDTHERAARLLAVEAGVPVLSISYRLAPENPFPAGLADCVVVWRQVRAGTSPLGAVDGPVAVAGDSAGANLALALMLHEQAESRPAPDQGLLFYGAYDADFGSQSYLEHACGPGLTRGKMMRYWNWYAPDPAARANPLIAPLRAADAALAALPPLYLNAAGIDPLRSDSENLHARLTALGRTDRLRIHRGVVHGFMQMSLDLAEARTATSEAAFAFREMAGASK